MFLDERTQYCKKVRSLPLMHKFRTKSLAGFLIEFAPKKESILEEKICKNNKKKIFKERMMRGLSLSDIELSSKNN